MIRAVIEGAARIGARLVPPPEPPPDVLDGGRMREARAALAAEQALGPEKPWRAVTDDWRGLDPVVFGVPLVKDPFSD